jgi:hypothetical protein
VLKYFLFIVLFFYLNIIYGQQTIEYHHNPLVNAKGLDEEILLFIPDTTTQIMINPARAASYDKKFIYTNYNANQYSSDEVYLFDSDYEIISDELELSIDGINLISRRPIRSLILSLPYYNTSPLEPAFSTSALFNAFGSKWLFNFTHGISHTKSRSDAQTSDSYIYDIDFHKRSLSSFDSEYQNRERSNTGFSLAKIGSSKLGNFAIELFGAYYQDKTNLYGNYLEYSNRIDFLNDINRIQDATNNGKESRIYTDQIYHIGLAYSLHSKSSDFITRISYQKIDFLEDVYDNDIITIMESITLDTIPDFFEIRESRVNRYSNCKNEYNPGIYQIYNYYQHKVKWLTGQDNIFVKMNGNYSSEKKKYTYNEEYLVTTQITRYNDENDYDADTMAINYLGTKNLDNWSAGVSCGYILGHSFADIFVLTGLNPQFQYTHFEDIDVNSSLVQYQNKTTGLVLKFPVYLDYSPLKWIEIYGGFNYYYVFQWLKRDYEYDYDRQINPGQTQNRNRKISNSYDYIRSSNSSYVGINLKHKSGLRFMLYFNNNLSNYKTWDISVGYHF